MRTKNLFISFVCCLVLQANVQAYNNTIVNDNSAWAILWEVVCPECPVWTQYVYFDGDSIVGEHTYKKVFSCKDRLHEHIQYIGLIREQEEKTYYIKVDSEKEYLLYDFSLEEGMTFEYLEYEEQPTSYYVKHVDFVEINGVQKKRIKLTPQPPYDTFIRATWIENVGSLNGLFYPCGILAPGSLVTLLCHFQNNELIYKNPEYSECYYDNITSVQTIVTDNCDIFPNPVDDILNISCLNNTILQIKIFDYLGQLIYNQEYKNTINVSSFSKGLYLLKVYDTNEQIAVFKIIKN